MRFSFPTIGHVGLATAACTATAFSLGWPAIAQAQFADSPEPELVEFDRPWIEPPSKEDRSRATPLPDAEEAIDPYDPFTIILLSDLRGGPKPVAFQAPSGEGRIIYSRDVSYGSAIGPRYPGRTDSVVTGPTNTILAAVTNGLTAITDDENATMVAPATPASELGNGQMRFSAEDLARHPGPGTQPANNGSVGGSSTANTVGQAMGSLRGALGSLKTALGGGAK